MKGERVPLTVVNHQADEAVLSEPSVVETKIMGRDERKALLLLDSGTDAAVLFRHYGKQSQELAWREKNPTGAKSDYPGESSRPRLRRT
jgi:hypothetical protein